MDPLTNKIVLIVKDLQRKIEAEKRKIAEEILSELVTKELPYHCPYCGKRRPFELCRFCSRIERCVENQVLGCPNCLGCESKNEQLRAT